MTPHWTRSVARLVRRLRNHGNARDNILFYQFKPLGTRYVVGLTECGAIAGLNSPLQLGTCSMMKREKGGVVDAQLNVYGVEGLKVAGETHLTFTCPLSFI